MCDSCIAVDIIHKYINQNLTVPSWPMEEICKKSYGQWAAYEICNRIMDCVLDDPIIIIEKFIFEMAMYTNFGNDEYRSSIFQTAIETAEELILLFI